MRCDLRLTVLSGPQSRQTEGENRPAKVTVTPADGFGLGVLHGDDQRVGELCRLLGLDRAGTAGCCGAAGRAVT